MFSVTPVFSSALQKRYRKPFEDVVADLRAK